MIGTLNEHHHRRANYTCAFLQADALARKVQGLGRIPKRTKMTTIPPRRAVLLSYMVPSRTHAISYSAQRTWSTSAVWELIVPRGSRYSTPYFR